MKKSFKFLTMATILIVLVTSITWWILHCFSCRADSDNFRSLTHSDWAKVLNLTKEQQEKLSELEEKIQPRFEQLTLQLAQVRLLLCDLLRKSEIKNEDLDKYTGEIGRLQADEEKSTVLHLLDIKKILNPEQSQKFFTSIMQDICMGCRYITDACDCQCGFCSVEQKEGK